MLYRLARNKFLTPCVQAIPETQVEKGRCVMYTRMKLFDAALFVLALATVVVAVLNA